MHIAISWQDKASLFIQVASLAVIRTGEEELTSKVVYY